MLARARALPVEVFTDAQRAIAPEKIADISNEDLVNTLIDLYSCKKSSLGASVQFFNSRQKQGQSIDELAKDVKANAALCNFEENITLSRIQRDVFLAGLSSKSLITSILQSSDQLTFEEAVQKAKYMSQLYEDTQKDYICIRCSAKNKIKNDDSSCSCVHERRSSTPPSCHPEMLGRDQSSAVKNKSFREHTTFNLNDKSNTDDAFADVNSFLL